MDRDKSSYWLLTLRNRTLLHTVRCRPMTHCSVTGNSDGGGSARWTVQNELVLYSTVVQWTGLTATFPVCMQYQVYEYDGTVVLEATVRYWNAQTIGCEQTSTARYSKTSVVYGIVTTRSPMASSRRWWSMTPTVLWYGVLAFDVSLSPAVIDYLLYYCNVS